MPIFDGQVKTKLAVSDPLTDHKLPDTGLLSLKSITEQSALHGTKGKQCTLVHGDYWNEIEGNHNENILKNQTLKVVGKHKETLVGTCYQNFLSPHIVQNNTVRNETRLGTFTKTHGSYDEQDDHDGHFVYSSVLMERCYVFDFEYYTSKVEIDLMLAQAMVLALTFGVSQATVSVFNNSWDGTHLSSKFLLQEIKNIGSDIAAWASHVGLGQGDFRCILNGCSDLGVGTPFR